ncbi:MAG: penicillin-binding protein 2 [Kangiellaceae bacterium]|nr:penicillin-binding protein 2 [Kangiellaceae bacterium]|tara:strand:+ start:1525 stop:3369 length:1845 start_codon:yes stop_codon:yes gene_type:complete
MIPDPRNPIKDHISETSLFVTRTVVAFLLVVLMLGGLVVRLVYLQIVKHENYETLSEKNRISIIPEAPTRGLIYDRNGVLLADNLPSFSLELIPEQIKSFDQTLALIKELINVSDDDVENYHKLRKRERRFKKIPLKRKLTEQEVAVISVNQHALDGVYIEARLQRHYPFGLAMAHVLGYVGRINVEELARLPEAQYRASRYIGKIGLEKHYESILHGDVGYNKVETDALGRVIRILEKTPPVPGNNLYLHLDSDLQLATEGALAGRRGAVVAIDPENGAVLALVSNPSFDPNLFVNGIDTKTYSQLRDDPDMPLFNRALRGRYAPGSTIKPALAFLGLQHGVITPSWEIMDPGWYSLPNDDHRYRDWKKWGHGKVDLETAIVQSCDTYYYELAYRLGIDRMHKGMSMFGFGTKTGLDIGEEASGIMPSRDWKRGAKQEPWYPGETLITGIGQGFWTATPLQIALHTAILSHHGVGYKPQLLASYETSEQFFHREKVPLDPISTQDDPNWTIVLEGMRKVVHGLRGTARTAFQGSKYVAGGKTGTAQVISIAQDEEYDEEKIALRHRDNALFVGFAPYDNPKIAVSVIIENAGHGGSEAAPVAKQVIDHYLLRP